MKSLPTMILFLVSGLWLNVSCGSSDDSSGNSSADAGSAGGPVPGAVDHHCDGVDPVTVDPATCNGAASAGGAADQGDGNGSPSAAGGAADCNQTHDAQYGDTLPNAEGEDDDCKYRASWTSTAIRLNEPVTFKFEAADTSGAPVEPLADGKLPLTRVDVYQPCEPNRRGPAQNLSAKIAQTAPGQFSVGPIRFDQSGRWVVRFHLYEQCVDGAASPHGHIAFFVDVH